MPDAALSACPLSRLIFFGSAHGIFRYPALVNAGLFVSDTEGAHSPGARTGPEFMSRYRGSPLSNALIKPFGLAKPAQGITSVRG